MSPHLVAESLDGLELILNHSLGRFSELRRLALQTLSLRIEMSPAHMEARVVCGLRRLVAMALRYAKRAVHANDEFQLFGFRRWNGDVPVLTAAERLLLARDVVDAMADDEQTDRIHRGLGLCGEAFGHHFGTSGCVSGVQIIEGTAEGAYRTVRRFASDKAQHALQLVKTDAERRCRQDQDTASVLLLPLQRVAELGVLAFGTMSLVDDQQVACQVEVPRGIGVLDDLNRPG